MIQQPPDLVIAAATEEALKSPCQKSKRGAVLFWGTSIQKVYIEGSGHNSLPYSLSCDGSDACRNSCGRRCVHAEQAAILNAFLDNDSKGESSEFGICDLLHIKVADGIAVPGGGPSCLECSKLILHFGTMGVWLWEDRPTGPEWVYRTAKEFNRATLENLGLPTT